MKIKDIIKESSYGDLLQRIADTDDPTERAELIARLEKQFPESSALDQVGGVGQGLKPEERLGSSLSQWFKKKWTTDPIADKFKAALEKRNAALLSGGGGTLVAKPTTSPYKEPDPTSDTLPGEPGSGLERKDNSQAILNTEKSKRDQAQDNADNKKRTKDNSQAIHNTEKSNRDQAQKRAAQRQKEIELARMKANAGMKDDDYKTSPGSKRTAQDLALDKEYTYKADDGRRLKYKQGDIRNAFHSSPDSRKAGSDKVIRGDRVGNRLVDKKPVPRTNQDDRAK